jgi:hypothetical protein
MTTITRTSDVERVVATMMWWAKVLVEGTGEVHKVHSLRDT